MIKGKKKYTHLFHLEFPCAHTHTQRISMKFISFNLFILDCSWFFPFSFSFFSFSLPPTLTPSLSLDPFSSFIKSCSKHNGNAISKYRQQQQQHSAGSSSNLSSSNSNNSDEFNSLDSMEHEIHQSSKNAGRHPQRASKGIKSSVADVHQAKNIRPIKTIISTAVTDPSAYLGPFNFRQLLRPIQGPTNSLRKRKNW